MTKSYQMHSTEDKLRDTLANSLYRSRKMAYPKHELQKIDVINKDIAVHINKGKHMAQQSRMQAS